MRTRSLTVQMVVTLVGLVILTAAAIGLPAVWLLWGQLGQHNRQVLEQSSRATQALISDQLSQLTNLALVTAQRPTLKELLQKPDSSELSQYLGELQRGAGLDLLALCEQDGSQVGNPIAPAGNSAGFSPCAGLQSTGPSLDLKEGRVQGWLLASQPIPEDPAGRKVLVGRLLDEEFTRQLREQTGMEVILLLEGKFLAASQSADEAAREALVNSLSGEPSTGISRSPNSITLDGIPYHYLTVTYPRTRLQLVLLLSTAELIQTQRELAWLAGLGILLVILFSSALGVLRARQISRPLERLRGAAEKLRRGDLSKPIVVRTNLREAAQVAYALEEARITLQHSLAQLRQEKDWVDHLLEAVVEGILTIDRRGRVTFFSQGAERITGWKVEQVSGRSVDEIFPTIDEEAPFSRSIPPPGGMQKIAVQLKGGRPATLAVTRARLVPPEAGRASAVLVLRDVSDEEAVHRLLGQFLANISHEFRTPLSALAASIELLMDQLPELSPAELRELLNTVLLGTLSLQTLIDNLLEGASIELGRFQVNPRPADLGGIIQGTVTTLEPLAEKYGQKIQVDALEDLPEVKADPRRTGQVLVNLLSNAIKWGPSGGVISITTTIEPAWVKVCVADQGPGIPEHRQTDLFSRFDRVQAREGQGEYGAGLGLSVVRAIITAQGGQVGAENRPGQGALFWFTLPIAALKEIERETIP